MRVRFLREHRFPCWRHEIQPPSTAHRDRVLASCAVPPVHVRPERDRMGCQVFGRRLVGSVEVLVCRASSVVNAHLDRVFGPIGIFPAAVNANARCRGSEGAYNGLPSKNHDPQPLPHRRVVEERGGTGGGAITVTGLYNLDSPSLLYPPHIGPVQCTVLSSRRSGLLMSLARHKMYVARCSLFRSSLMQSSIAKLYQQATAMFSASLRQPCRLRCDSS